MDQNLIPRTPVPNDSYPDLPKSSRMGNYFSPQGKKRRVAVAQRDPVKYRVEQPTVATGAYPKPSKRLSKDKRSFVGSGKSVPQVVADT